METARVKHVVRLVLRNLTRIFFLFPIKDGRILFTVLDGESVSDNPRYVYNFLEEHCPDRFEYIWVYNGDRTNTDLPVSVKIIKRQTLKWFYYMATSKVVVDNWPPSLIVPPRKRQLYIETWHAGGAYKKIGKADSAVKNNYQRRSADLKIRTIKIFVSSSEGFTRWNIEEGYQFKGEILGCGMPRNDAFFYNEAIKENSDKIKRYYSLHGLVALYAPTFRGEVYKTTKINDIIDLAQIREALKEKYHMDVDILVRCHPVDKYSYNFGDNVIDAGDYPDMQELLCAADILITDYSSCMWDFAILGRPCLLFTPDIDQYIRDRGFFTSPEQWPGIICRNMDELCNEIINLDEEACAAKAKRHLELMGSYETGHATEIIANRIVEYMNGD